LIIGGLLKPNFIFDLHGYDQSFGGYGLIFRVNEDKGSYSTDFCLEAFRDLVSFGGGPFDRSVYAGEDNGETVQ
jgi:hypothetical protein